MALSSETTRRTFKRIEDDEFTPRKQKIINDGSVDDAEIQRRKSATASAEPQMELEWDRNFLQFLDKENISIVVSSYKSNNLYQIGRVIDKKDNAMKISLLNTAFTRPLGMHYDKANGVFWVITNGHLFRYQMRGQYDNGRENGKIDGLFYPQSLYTVGDVDGHDICVDDRGVPHFVSAMFSAVCVPSHRRNFNVAWSPPWVERIAAEDRCHLNGICARDNVPRYVSCCGKTDMKESWISNRIGGGIIYDIITDAVVCEGLTMPHSPRWYQDKLWVCNAGTGEFGHVDFATKKFIPIAFIPGYLRGCSFVGNYAVVGASHDRFEKVFADLPLGKRIEDAKISSKCGVFVIDLKTGDVITNFIFTRGVGEIYDVEIIHDIQRPCFFDINTQDTLHTYDYV